MRPSPPIWIRHRRYQSRLAGVPKVTYPDNLPVSQKQAEIAKAIEEHQVVIIAGETGSGKTTQIPKICLALGRGVKGFIGHPTAPSGGPHRRGPYCRRDGVRTRALRGLQGALYRSGGEQTHIKLMTDGILLAEIQNDRMLTHDTIIIDEAHERSLNIDFILGYLKQLLPKPPISKVIITSATIDPQRFSRHFNKAPVIGSPVAPIRWRCVTAHYLLIKKQ